MGKQWWGIVVAALVGGALGAAFTYAIVVHYATL
jgi:hypothetical protein